MAKGPRAVTNEDLWGKATIYRMLTNRTLCRQIWSRADTKRSAINRKRPSGCPKKDWIVVPGTHEGHHRFRDSFARVQQMLRAHARGGGRGTVNPLAGKVCLRDTAVRAMEQTASGCAGKNAGKALNRYFPLPHLTAGQEHAVRDRTICPWSSCRSWCWSGARHHIAGHLEAGMA